MWKLQPCQAGTGVVCLLPGKEYVVGRKNCDILLSNDQSISRVHAKLTVTEQMVTLKDSSKYGTFVNDERLDTGSHKTLNPGDSLTFGVFQSKFKLERETVVVCSSCVDNDGKAALSQAVQSVGGRMVSTWTQECTHLVMPAVKVTIKTICALLCCRPIVKPEFFTELSSALQRKETLPEAESFRPAIDEPSLTKRTIDLNPRPERRSLFTGKTFVFLNVKQMKRLSQAVSCGGGKSQLLEEGTLPTSLLESAGTCVIEVVTGSSQTIISPVTKKWAESVGQLLHRNGLRFITESEIGLAAIYVDKETYCNPRSFVNSESLRERPVIPGATLSQNTAVDETVLPAASQNITAYVNNTEASQGVTGKNECEATAVGETPEKRPTRENLLRATKLSTSSRVSPPTTGPPTSRTVVDTVKSSNVKHQEKRPESALVGSCNDDLVKNTAPQDRGAALTKSPQKQSSLTSFFQPISKKRPREESTSSEQSEAKLPRQEQECEKSKDTKNSNLASAPQSNSASRYPVSQNKNRTDTQPDFSASLGLGLGSGLGTNTDHSLISGSKKRKEPEQKQLSDPDLNLSLEELESIMSDDMDEPVQPAANKKQRLDQEEDLNSYSKSGATSSNQWKAAKQQTVAGKSKNLERKKLSEVNRSEDLGRNLPHSSSRISELEQEESSSAYGKHRYKSEDLKEEEVSFLVEAKVQNGVGQCSGSGDVKQEPKSSSSATGPENNPELPSKLMQVQFKSLTVSAPSMTRAKPLHSRDPNAKNFKSFRKAPVPGLQGLPNIIGGSDLVAHNRSKNSEFEEWLRDAAEEEKQQRREETLGDDLFRYNPKPTKRR